MPRSTRKIPLPSMTPGTGRTLTVHRIGMAQMVGNTHLGRHEFNNRG